MGLTAIPFSKGFEDRMRFVHVVAGMVLVHSQSSGYYYPYLSVNLPSLGVLLGNSPHLILTVILSSKFCISVFQIEN